MGKNENLKVMVVSLYRPSSAYYSSRSAFCCNEQDDSHSPADELFSFISNGNMVTSCQHGRPETSEPKQQTQSCHEYYPLVRFLCISMTINNVDSIKIIDSIETIDSIKLDLLDLRRAVIVYKIKVFLLVGNQVSKLIEKTDRWI